MDIKDVKGLILSDDNVISVLKKKLGKDIPRLEKVDDGFKVFFDPSEDVNALILGPEDLIKILKAEFGRNIISVEGGRYDEYVIRFVE